MNKTKVILISIGGAAALGAVVIAALTYFGVASDSEEPRDDIEVLEDEASGLLGKSVSPEKEKAVKDNCKSLGDWKNRAMACASSGDQKLERKTPASFKAEINDEAKRIAELPGSADGHFVKPEFGFGFDEYIHKGKLPAEAELECLQRQWNDISAFFGILIEAKVSSVTELRLAKDVAEVQDTGRRGRKKAKSQQDDSNKPDVTRFEIVFNAGPEALVEVLNDIAASGRFIVAEEMSFVRTPDTIAEKLGAKSAKKQEGGRRRRPHAAQAADNAADGDAPVGTITDPASVDDYKVTMKIAVYDFRTKAKPESAKEEQ